VPGWQADNTQADDGQCTVGAEAHAGRTDMKKGIHPEYVTATVQCACGNTFTTRATVPEIRVDICNACHPFFTGQQKYVDTTGRVERFQKKFGGDYFKKSSRKSKGGQ